MGSFDAEEKALDGLILLLASTDLLSPETPSCKVPLWNTYRADIRRCSALGQSAAGNPIRYLKWSDVPDIFVSRRRKVQELVRSAENSCAEGRREEARCYCEWAEVYLRSLPPGEDALRQRLTALQTGLAGVVPASLRMRNVETEVSAIRQALHLSQPQAGSPFVREKLSAAQSARRVAPVPEPANNHGDRAPERMETLVDLSSLIPGDSLLAWAAPVRLSKPVSLPASASLQPLPSSRQARVSAVVLMDWDRGFVPGIHVSCLCGQSGPYVSLRTQPFSHRPVYQASSDGATEFGYLWASGAARCRHDAYSAGWVYWIGPQARRFDKKPVWGTFAGIGYGRSDLLWEDTAGEWAKIVDLSSDGWLVEAGVQFRSGSLVAVTGLSVIRFQRPSLFLGLGWMF